MTLIYTIDKIQVLIMFVRDGKKKELKNCVIIFSIVKECRSLYADFFVLQADSRCVISI